MKWQGGGWIERNQASHGQGEILNASVMTVANPKSDDADGHGLASPGKLAELYLAHAGDAYRLAYLLTGNRDDANDLVQEAFIRITTRFRHLRNQDSFAFYLRRTLINLARSEARRRSLARRVTRASAEASADIAMPDVATRDELFRALLLLPPRQRVALVLRFYEDLTEDQTAAILGTSARAVNALVSRGLANLRRQEVTQDE